MPVALVLLATLMGMAFLGCDSRTHSASSTEPPTWDKNDVLRFACEGQTVKPEVVRFSLFDANGRLVSSEARVPVGSDLTQDAEDIVVYARGLELVRLAVEELPKELGLVRISSPTRIHTRGACSVPLVVRHWLQRGHSSDDGKTPLYDEQRVEGEGTVQVLIPEGVYAECIADSKVDALAWPIRAQVEVGGEHVVLTEELAIPALRIQTDTGAVPVERFSAWFDVSQPIDWPLEKIDALIWWEPPTMGWPLNWPQAQGSAPEPPRGLPNIDTMFLWSHNGYLGWLHREPDSPLPVIEYKHPRSADRWAVEGVKEHPPVDGAVILPGHWDAKNSTKAVAATVMNGRPMTGMPVMVLSEGKWIGSLPDSYPCYTLICKRRGWAYLRRAEQSDNDSARLVGNWCNGGVELEWPSGKMPPRGEMSMGAAFEGEGEVATSSTRNRRAWQRSEPVLVTGVPPSFYSLEVNYQNAAGKDVRVRRRFRVTDHVVKVSIR